MNIKNLKQHILEAHSCIDTYDLLFKIYGDISNFFLSQDFLKIGRIIIMLKNDIIIKMQPILEMAPFGEKAQAIFDIAGVYGEVSFLERLLITSCGMMKQSNSWTDEQEIRENYFKDLLNVLEIQDIFPDIPEKISSYRQAKKLSDLMISKVEVFEDRYHEYVRSYEEEPSNFPKFYIGFWRGENYYMLKHFQKDTSLRLALVEKSIKLWEQWLSETFSKDQLTTYLKEKNDGLLSIYVCTLKQHIENYKEIIGAKSYDLVQMDLAREGNSKVRALLKDLNLLRFNFIMVMKRVLNLCKKRPDLISNEMKRKMNHSLALQYHSIILEDKGKQQDNVEASRPYVLQILGADPGSSNDQLFYFFCEATAKHDFIKKFEGY